VTQRWRKRLASNLLARRHNDSLINNFSSTIGVGAMRMVIGVAVAESYPIHPTEIRSRTVIGVELELPRESDSFSEGNHLPRLHWSRARGMKLCIKASLPTPKVHHPKDCCCVSLRDQLVDYTQTFPSPFACKMILLILHRKRSRFQSRHTFSPSTMSLATSAAMLTVDSRPWK
jgi:hypothetical protein